MPLPTTGYTVSSLTALLASGADDAWLVEIIDPVGQVHYKMTVAQLKLLATEDAVADNEFAAQSLLISVTPGNPTSQVVGEGELVGRPAGGNIGSLTAAQVRAILNVEDGAAADQSAAEVPFTPDGDIAATNTQAAIVEVRDDTDTKLAGKAAVGHAADHVTGGSDEIDGDQIDIDFTPSNYTPNTTPAEVTNLDHLSAHLSGIDVALAGAGLAGPVSSTDNAISRFDGTDGDTLQNSGVTIDDSNNLDTPGNITVGGTVDGRDVAADGAKLDGIEPGANVTDGANVSAAGAVMDVDFAGSNAGAMVRTGATTYAIVQHNLGAAVAPGVTDDSSAGYGEGSLWVDATANEVYFCADPAVGAAVWRQIGSGGGTTDHGLLTGLADDDHVQYILVNGSRAMTGALDMGTNAITNVGNVDGRDVSADGTKLDGIEASADVTDATNVAAAGAVMDSDFSGSNAGALIRTGAGSYAVVQHNLSATAAPTLTSDTNAGYSEGSLWVNATANQVYFCADATAGAAVWKRIEGHHGDLVGLTDDDHVQYLLVNGTRAMSGSLNMGGNNITSVGTVDGRDLSADGTKLDGIEAGATADQTAIEVPFTPNGDIAATNTQAAIVEVRDDTDTKLAGKADTSHAASHLTGGSDEIDGDRIDIDYTPVNYTPTTAPAEVTNLDHLTAHLAGIDNAITSGSGDVVGPASATDNAIPRYDGTTGKLIQGSGVTIDDSNNIAVPGTVDGRDISVDGTKLDSIESGADVTDAVNVAASGAVMDTDFSGSNAGALIRTGAASYDVVQHNLGASVGPSVTDDSSIGYSEGSLWVDASANQVYLCADPTVGAAVWRQVGSGGGTTDHGLLTGLSDDDHTQYLLTSGARAMTGALNVGSNGITNAGSVSGVSQIDHTLGTAPAHSEGRVFYDEVEHTLAVYNDDANVTHQLGQEALVRVYNGTGSIITNGSVVYEAGVQIEAGVGRPSVALARSDDPATANVLGVVTADIANNSYGYVTRLGFVNGIDLSPFSNGELVYLSETTAGGLRSGLPPFGNVPVQIGIAVEAIPSGRLLVLIVLEDVPEDSRIPLSNTIGSPTVDSLTDKMDRLGSPGVFTGGVITDDGDGTVTVSPGTGLIRATNSDTAALLSFDWVSTPITPAVSDITYIYIEYNSGAPQVVGTVTPRTDDNTNIFLGTVHRNATAGLHITNRPPKLTSFARDTHLRFVDIDGLARASGAVVGETGTRNITVTEATLYLGIDKITSLVGGFDSSGADTFVSFYRDGVGGWAVQTAQTQVSNSQYDDGSGTLASLGSNRYGVYWIYVGIDDHVYLVYGRGNYTSTGAADATPPSDIPPHMQEHHAVLAAKIIVQQGSTSFTSLISAFAQRFVGTATVNHNDLSGLQGGATDDYQHLTTAQLTKLNGIETGATADQSAAEVPFTPNGDIAASTVQAAVVEVRDDTDTKLTGKLDTSHAGSGGSAHANAVAGGAAGFMTGADKTKLDGIETAADVTDSVNVNAAGAVMESDYGANSILAASTVGTPASLTVEASRLVGRASTGGIAALTASEARTVLSVSQTSDVVLRSLFDAQTILAATTDNTPAAVTVGEGQIVGRATGGNVGALTAAQVRTILNVEDGAAADQSASEVPFTPDGDIAATNTQAAVVEVRNDTDTKLTGKLDTSHEGAGGAVHANVIAGGAAGFMTGSDKTKLDGIETAADVTDATNVAAAGAVMDTDFSGSNAGALIRTGASSYSVLQHNLSATAAPAAGNDTTQGYAPGSLWVDLTNDQVYLCADAGTGAAVWRQVASGGGGGTPSIDTLEGFTSGNRYDAASNAFAGATTGFLFAALVEVLDIDGAAGQSIVSNINFGTDGWQLNIESDGRFQATIIDTAGGAVSATAGGVDTLNDGVGQYIATKHFLALGQVVQNGTNNDVTLWVNGQKSPVTAGTNPYAPVTDTPQIGAGAFGNVAADTGIAGIAYLAGTLTDAEIRDWFHACYDARDLVTDGLGWTIYSVKRGSPASTWTASNGSGPTFNRVGSLTSVTRSQVLWG